MATGGLRISITAVDMYGNSLRFAAVYFRSLARALNGGKAHRKEKYRRRYARRAGVN
jgi:hypothetical protein